MASIYDKSSLVLIPSGTKTGKVFSQKPVSGDGDFTFTRASAATRVNADGNIEKETQNLLLQSNTFNTTWGSNGTLTSGQSGYDGSSDAWLFNYTTDPSIAFVSNTNSGVQTISLYAKGSVSNGLRIYSFGSLNCQAYFDLNIGSVENTSNIIDATIEDKGNGWYRCSMTFNQTNSSINFYLSNNANLNATSGSIYIQDAQLEEGLVARDYIETTTAAVYGGITDNTPRLDYTDSSCPALLLEPQRTNDLVHSEYIYAGAGYSFTGTTTATYNSAVSPEGVQNAALFDIPYNNGGFYNFGTGGSKSIGDKITLSVFAKLKSGSATNVLAIGYGGVAVGGDKLSEFNLSTGIITYSHPNADSVSIEDYGNGWYRLIQTQTCTAAGTAGLVVYGRGETDVYIWGVQSELGSYATSYIPTYGSSVSRVADVSSVTGISDILNDNEGTLFIEMSALANDQTSRRLSISDGTNNNRVMIGYSTGSNALQFVLSDGGAVVVNSAYTLSDITETAKIAFKYKVNDCEIYVNGSRVILDTTATMPSGLDVLGFYQGSTNENLFANVKQVTYFPTALTDQELIDLTTL